MSDITGTLVYTFYGEDNVATQQAEDLSTKTVEAYVWSGTSWTPYVGSGTANGDFMIGPGNITYRTGQTDSSIVYELGGGVDYHKNRWLNFRMIDFQYQFWDLGDHYYPPGFLPGQPGVYIDTKLKPYTLSFGVLIRVR